MRGVIVLLVGLGLAASADAAPPAVTATASPTTGVAPLQVVLTATGDGTSYSWDLGDGSSAEGPLVTHTYAAGRFVATVTATSSSGEQTQAQVAVTAVARRLALEAPRIGGYASRVTLAGSLQPPPRAGSSISIYRGRTYVTTARLARDGRFKAPLLLRSPGPYHARYGRLRSAEISIRVRPAIETRLAATVTVGTSVAVRARVVPPSAGTLRTRVLRGRRLVATGKDSVRLPTRVPGKLTIEVLLRPRAGYGFARSVVTTSVVHPALSPGVRGPSVLALERRLAELRYTLRGVDSSYGRDTFEAVLAFQKVHWLPRTGRVEPWLWRRLASASIPRAARGGSYLEVDKARQVLFEVRGGKVLRVVHVSTGATGNTPLGTWRVYRKVGGWDWVLWYPLYFLRGFAIHGYPEVPAYPASHGCVRVPMWLAPTLFSSHGYGTTVFVHG
ncbi:MAG: L,D-transpeptidase family protein [Actinobacteria bacterium]|nr:L,D-transpeptidase family protein [Actinomycetota bacterium]